MVGTERKQRCHQCWRDRAMVLFRSKDGTRYVQTCRDCRKHYQGWDRLSLKERLSRMRKKPRGGNGYTVHLVLDSRNRKTGRMPVSTTDQRSCPDACVFKDAGCYAEFGKMRAHWQKVPERGVRFSQFLQQVRALPPGIIWRHNEAGDLPGIGDRLDATAVKRLAIANDGRRGFTFTHKPMKLKSARQAVDFANRQGFTINLSANSLKHADELARLGIAPVAVVLPENSPDKLTTPEGRSVIVCLNETKRLTCLECQLCAVSTRKSIVGFRAHGQAKAIVTQLVTLRLKKAS